MNKFCFLLTSSNAWFVSMDSLLLTSVGLTGSFLFADLILKELGMIFDLLLNCSCNRHLILWPEKDLNLQPLFVSPIIMLFLTSSNHILVHNCVWALFCFSLIFFYLPLHIYNWNLLDIHIDLFITYEFGLLSCFSFSLIFSLSICQHLPTHIFVSLVMISFPALVGVIASKWPPWFKKYIAWRWILSL